MKNSIKLTFTRIGLVEKNNQLVNGHLPELQSTSQIEDINQIQRIFIEGDGFEEIINAMPKSYKWSICQMGMGSNIVNVGFVKFDTFYVNATTGDKNESAIKRRIKVIEKLASLGY